MSPARTRGAPVLVVGAGPVGLLQAYALSRLDVPVVLLGRHRERLGAPKAHALSPRSLEICRQLGISVSDIRKYPAPRHEASWVRFVTTLSGEEVGSLPYERMSLDVLDDTPEMLHNISQPDFEALLTRLVENDPNIDFRRGCTWVSAQEVEAGEERVAVSVVEDTYTGDRSTIPSSLIIGCDGANSRVRKGSGITVDAEESADTMMTIHFSADLRPVVGERVGMLHWIMHPAARGFIIAYDLGGNQVLIHNFDLEHHPLDSFTDEKCISIVRQAIGRDVPFEFHSRLPWILRRQVAHDYASGRIVLAGDSAHAFPPTGGLGLNSGIADAHNLAYKIAAVYNRGADLNKALRSYQDERRPIAERNSKQSVKNGKSVFGLLKALKNTDPDVEVATAQMYAALRDPGQKRQIQSLIAQQREHFDNLMLHIGYVYEDGWDPDSATDFIPAYRRGARLPHEWINIINPAIAATIEPVDLEYLKGDLADDKRASWRYSTLDLVNFNSHTLIVSGNVHKAEALASSLRESRIPVDLVQIDTDFDFVDGVKGQRWQNGFSITEGGAILVRPDQHIQAVFTRDYSVESAVSQAVSEMYDL